MSVVKNKDLFKTNSDVHSFNTRSHYDLHIPAANLTVFQNGVRYSGTKIYNHFLLPLNNYQMIFLNLKRPWKDVSIQTLFIHWRSIIAGNRDLVLLPLHPGNTIHHCTAAKLLHNLKHLRLYIQVPYVACVVNSYTVNNGPLKPDQ